MFWIIYLWSIECLKLASVKLTWEESIKLLKVNIKILASSSFRILFDKHYVFILVVDLLILVFFSVNDSLSLAV